MSESTLRTGEVAAEAGVNVQTLRYYERRGLLQKPKRRPSGYRDYPHEAVKIVRFIKGAQELGFTLTEIEDLLRLRSDPCRTCARVKTVADAKIEDINRRIRMLRMAKHALVVLVGLCTSDSSGPECAILEAFARGERKPRKKASTRRSQSQGRP